MLSHGLSGIQMGMFDNIVLVASSTSIPSRFIEPLNSLSQNPEVAVLPSRNFNGSIVKGVPSAWLKFDMLHWMSSSNI